VQKRTYILEFFLLLIIFGSASFKRDSDQTDYQLAYSSGLKDFSAKQSQLLANIENIDFSSPAEIQKVKEQINLVRHSLKNVDFWFRYLEPVSYKKINGPLPVEWETEVFEKFEKPYKREGAGLMLAATYLEEEQPKKDSLLSLIRLSLKATQVYSVDSITENLKTHHHFYLCNRLYLLNLAAIYTTGFECPDAEQIIPELRLMLTDVYSTYLSFNRSFPATTLPSEYLDLYKKAITFANNQSGKNEEFDHFVFIKDYINPLFTLNRQLIRQYSVTTKSYVDYSLNKNSSSIFSKSLYRGQNIKGIFLRVYDKKQLEEIEKIGRLLFYDPILSGNNLRSCASCHKPTEFFTDTAVATSMQFDRKNFLPRNSPSLINSQFNHLIMADGHHISLQDQAKAVITSSVELACAEKDILKKVLSCSEYKTAFKQFLKYTPQEPEITLEHISSALTIYYSKFGLYNSPFDDAMNKNITLAEAAKRGFNLFMSKAECATCHFAPQFNGVKPPYVGSEFEVLGIPKDTSFVELSADKGRYNVNPAFETAGAFRTGTLRNSENTKPYMHNGVFKTLDQVIEFYNAGGGAGHGLKVPNQTLNSHSLYLSQEEKKQIVAFINTLNEKIEFEAPPETLPVSKIKSLNKRKVGGEY
jgi:cytochrome c peroxidase